MADQSKSSVDGNVDDLLLSDGFSIVDSTNPKTDGKEEELEAPAAETNTTRSSVSTSNTIPSPAKDKSQESGMIKPEPAEAEEKPSDSSSKDKVKGHDANKSDALLITTEEDLEMVVADKEKKIDEVIIEDSPPPPPSITPTAVTISATTTTVPVTTSTPKDDAKLKKSVKEKVDSKRKTGDVWVSNITRHVKATDLKKHFSRYGKVITAKIVTNGRSFFGYILMETPEIAGKCVRNLHGTILDNKKISVSRQRPDAQRRAVKPVVKTSKPPTSTTSNTTARKSVEKKESIDDGKSEDKKPTEKSADVKKDDALKLVKRVEDKLRREVDYWRREATRLRRNFAEEQRRRRLEQSKCRTVSRELQDTEMKLKEERRKYERERELSEKNARTDRVRVETDRSNIRKELEEVKKLREYLKRKIDEEQSRSAERRARPSPPYTYATKRFRDGNGDKMPSTKYMEERTRTPPSPPKLSSRKRSPIMGPFGIEKDRRHYEMGDRYEKEMGGMVSTSKPSAPAAPRNIWPSAFHQEVWRVPPGGGSSGSNNVPFSTNQYGRQSEYGANSKGSNYSQQREFGNTSTSSKREHYSTSMRKY